LVYNYNWSQYEKDDPRIYGILDSTEFNRKEGWNNIDVEHPPFFTWRYISENQGGMYFADIPFGPATNTKEG
jgi:hypothetical protein